MEAKVQSLLWLKDEAKNTKFFHRLPVIGEECYLFKMTPRWKITGITALYVQN